jgi:ABC-type transporter Mla subunit MlaD
MLCDLPRRNFLKFLSFITTLPFETQIFIGFIVLLTIGSHVSYGEKTLAYGPTILTTTGIFATFLGIALGLSGFDTADIQASVPALLAGLKTAFWASVVGVGGALTIKLRHFFIKEKQEFDGSGVDGEITASDLAKLLQGIQQALVGSDDSTLVSQLKLSRQDTNDRLDALKEAQREALLKLSEMGSKSLVEALRDVIKDFNGKLTEQFGDNFKQLNEAVARLLVWQEQYKDHVEEMTKRHMEIVDSMGVASDNYSSLVSKADTFTKISTDLSTLLTSLETQKQHLIGALESLSSLLTAASGSLPEIEKKVMELTGQLASSVENNQKEISKALAENVQFIRISIQGVGQDFAKINQDLNKHFEELAERTNKQVSVLDAALSEELKRSLESLGRQLAALSEKFVSDYSPLTNKLRDLVSMAREIS